MYNLSTLHLNDREGDALLHQNHTHPCSKGRSGKATSTLTSIEAVLRSGRSRSDKRDRVRPHLDCPSCNSLLFLWCSSTFMVVFRERLVKKQTACWLLEFQLDGTHWDASTQQSATGSLSLREKQTQLIISPSLKSGNLLRSGRNEQRCRL